LVFKKVFAAATPPSHFFKQTGAMCSSVAPKNTAVSDHVAAGVGSPAPGGSVGAPMRQAGDPCTKPVIVLGIYALTWSVPAKKKALRLFLAKKNDWPKRKNYQHFSRDCVHYTVSACLSLGRY
jgi:hypothetical protein